MDCSQWQVLWWLCIADETLKGLNQKGWGGCWAREVLSVEQTKQGTASEDWPNQGMWLIGHVAIFSFNDHFSLVWQLDVISFLDFGFKRSTHLQELNFNKVGITEKTDPTSIKISKARETRADLLK